LDHELRISIGVGRTHPLRSASRWLACLSGSALLIFVAYASALAAAERLLAVRTGVEVADVILVLGGDGPHRAARAVNLFRQGFAPRLVISGDGDCLDIRQLMMEAGVPEAAIEVECASRNTFENAEFTAPILATMGARRALLVTSWFHTRRALGCFRKASPGVGWMSAPVDADKPIWHLLWDTEGMQIAKEYPKVGWYAWHYGVPWSPEPQTHREARGTIQ
jgi:uncharacterized SAM-binding protein YcdF (DUF218 family)